MCRISNISAPYYNELAYQFVSFIERRRSMKTTIFKAVVVFLLALTIVTVGTTTVSSSAAGETVCRHDGPHDGMGGQ